jgi:zinc protease
LRRELDIYHFDGHPYGRDPLLGMETVPRITREDLKLFLKKYFVPSNMVVGVAGDIELPEVLKGLKECFKAFPTGSAPKRELENPPDTGPVLALVHKPGQIQSHVGMALPSVRRSNPDFWKLNLLANILGGSDSLMFKRLREDMGLVYVTGFYQTYMWRAGILKGYIAANGPNTGRALEETIKIMQDLRKNVPEKLLEQKRLDFLNSFVFNLDDRDDLVKAYGLYALRKEPLNTLDKIQESYMSVTKAELDALAKKFLDTSKLQIIVVGDKTTRVKGDNGTEISLEDDLRGLAQSLGIPFQEIPLR